MPVLTVELNSSITLILRSIAILGLIVGCLPGDKNSSRQAVASLERNTDAQLMQAIETCKNIVQRIDRLVLNEYGYLARKEVPERFRVLGADLDSVRVYEGGCTIHLHKGIGRGIGYFIDQRGWSISWFNHYQSWENHKMILRQASKQHGI